MPHWLLNLDVMNGQIPAALRAITVIAAVILLVRDNAKGWMRRALPAVGIGGVIGAAVVWVCNTTNAFGVPLPAGTASWAAIAGACIGLGIVSLWRSQLWRKILAGLLIVAAPLTAGMGINAGFGLTRTIGDVFGISTISAASLPKVETTQDDPAPVTKTAGSLPLYATWKPPVGMPATGRVGALRGEYAIPSTGGFRPRVGNIYLPPAALVKNPPALPLVVLMMGQPGWPDPTFAADALNTLAAQHHGLAPIVIVADQLGAETGQQPACSADSIYGDVSQYFNNDIVQFALHHLNVSHNPRDWTIAGYSDGGACAIEWGAQFPKIWGNVISISGDAYPAASEPAARLRDGFRGNVTLERENMPSPMLARNRGQYPGHWAIFTAGSLDPVFSRYAADNSELFRRAGFTTLVHEIPGGTHVGTSLSSGLLYAFRALYPVVGLQAAY